MVTDAPASRRAPTAGPPRRRPRRGRLDLPGRGVERPARHLAARRADQGRRPAWTPNWSSRRARGCSPRAAEGAPAERRTGTTPGRRRARCATGYRPGLARLGAGDAARGAGAGCWPLPAARLRHRSDAAVRCGSSASARCSAPGTSSSRAPRAPSSPERRPPRQRHVRAPRPSGCPRSPRWASTSSTCRPIHPIGRPFRKGPNNTLDPGPDDPGVAVGDRLRRGRPRRDPPRPGHPRRLRRVRRARPATSGSRSPWTSPCSAPRTTPGSTSTRSGSRTGPTARIAYAENPPKKYQDIYPLNFDNDPDGPVHRGRCGCCGTGWPTACGSSGSTTRTPSRCAFWEGLLAEIARTDPDVLFLAEAFTRPAMMRQLGKVGFQQSYTYFTWRTGKRELPEYVDRAAPTRPRPTCAPTSS